MFSYTSQYIRHTIYFLVLLPIFLRQFHSLKKICGGKTIKIDMFHALIDIFCSKHRVGEAGHLLFVCIILENHDDTGRNKYIEKIKQTKILQL